MPKRPLDRLTGLVAVLFVFIASHAVAESAQSAEPPAAQRKPVYSNADSVQPLQVGERIPSVVVRSIDGEPVDLAKRLRDQGALLVFYRGGW